MDLQVCAEGAQREHELRTIAAETKALREILAEAEAQYWEREIAKKVYP